MSPTLHAKDTLLTAVGRQQTRAARHLLSLQHPDGYWCALLTADTTLESDYILLQLWMYPPVSARTPACGIRRIRGRIQRAADRILSRQLPDGGFNIYVKGPSEISASVKAYFALKLAGMPVESHAMLKLRVRILALGGIQAANSYTKVNLSLFDLYPREGTPSIPPEIMLLPGKLLYQMSSWTRAIVISLAIVHAHDPKRPVPAGFNLDELFIPGKSTGFRERRFLAELAQYLRPVRQDPQAVGELRFRPHPQGRHAQVRALDARTDETRRRSGRHLSADAVFDHGARRSRYTPKIPRCAWKRSGSSKA